MLIARALAITSADVQAARWWEDIYQLSFKEVFRKMALPLTSFWLELSQRRRQEMYPIITGSQVRSYNPGVLLLWMKGTIDN